MRNNPSGSRSFVKENGLILRQFLCEAQKHGYGAATPEKTPDGGSRVEYISGCGHWRSVDIWYGGEPFSGMTTVWKMEAGVFVPCFNMTYWGRVMPFADQEKVLATLTEALQHPELEHPWRGPHRMRSETGLRYRNVSQGGVKKFSGREVITQSGHEQALYECVYMGGVINKD